jgi:hypothetical protein
VAHAPVPATEPVGAPFTVTATLMSVSHTWNEVVPVLVTFPTKALLVFVEATGPLTITSSAPSFTTGMIVTVTVPGDVLTFPLVSVALYWNVTVAPLVVAPLSVNVATHGVGELLTVTLSRGSDGLPANAHDATATLSVAGKLNVMVPPAFMLVLPSPATGGVTSGAAATCNARLAVAVSGVESESVAVTATVKSPVTVGVPKISPVDELMFNPAGRPVADHDTGGVPPELVSVVE